MFLGKTCYHEVCELLALLICVIIYGLVNNCQFPWPLSTRNETTTLSISDVKFVDLLFENVSALIADDADGGLTQKFNEARRRANIICAKHCGVFYQLELAKDLRRFVGRMFGRSDF